MSSLKDMFKKQKPTHRKNFVHENVKQLREMQNYYNNDIQSQVTKLPRTKYQPHRLNNKSMEPPGRHGEFHQSTKLHAGNKTAIYARSVPKLIINKQMNKINSPPRRNRLGLKVQRDINNYGSSSGVHHHHVQRQMNVKDRSPSTTDSDNISGPSSSETNIVLRDMGCQTLEPNEVAILYKKGVIICPSLNRQSTYFKSQDVSGSDAEDIENISPVYKPSRPDNICSLTSLDYRPPGEETCVDTLQMPLSNMSISNDRYSHTGCGDKHEEIDFVKLNTKVVLPKNKIHSTKTPDPTAPPPNYQRGVVPKYLRNRQDMQQRTKGLNQIGCHPDCPPGHVALADAEKRDTLRALRKNYSDLIHELNMMPVRSDTLKLKNRKIDIEKQLNRLEEAIKVFSKPQVFIKIGD